MVDGVVVLGMHRSGTSAVAGVAVALGGAAPSTLLPANDFNAKGYYESAAIMRLNDELLDSAGSDWRDWRKFSPEWHGTGTAALFRKRATSVFSAEFGDAPVAILKDPRICRFAPFWLGVLRDMDVRPRILIPVRSPLEVAQSLHKAHGLSISAGLLLWLRHVVDAERDTRDLPRSIFTWTEFQSDFLGVAKRIASDTGMAWPRLSDRTSHEVERFLARDLVHHHVDPQALAANPNIHEWTLAAYEALCELAQNPQSNSARERLDQVRDLFEKSCALFGRLFVENEFSAAQTALQIAALQPLQAEFGALQRAHDELARTSGEASGSHDRLIREIDDLKQANAAVVAEAQAAQAAWNGEIARFLSEKDLDRQAVAEALSARNASEAAAASALAEVGLAREAGNQAVRTLVAERDTLLEERDHLRQERDASVAELARARSALAETSSRAAALQDELSNAERHHQRSTMQIDTLEEQLRKAEGERNRIAEQIDKLRDDQHQSRLALDLQTSRMRAAFDGTLSETKTAYEDRLTALRAKLVDAEAAHARSLRDAKPRSVGARLANRPLFEERRLMRSGLFDAEWYAQEYPEVAKAGQTPARHYLQQGSLLGYWPNAMFDSRWYLDRYEDVRRSGVNPLLHYAKYGCREGRDPSPNFQTDFYLDSNPDVRALGTNPLEHYLRHGRHEGRLPKRSS